MNQHNILLIVTDTMRRDAVSVYNNNVRTPNIEYLSKNAVIYNNAISPAPWTVPAHASIFTGKYLNEHKLHETSIEKDIDLLGKMNNVKYKTISEILQKEGYNTIGLSANPFISPGSGFDRGFNMFIQIENYYDSFLRDSLGHNENKKKTDMIINYFKNNGIIKTMDLYKIYKLRSKGSNSIFYDKGGYSITKTINNMSLKEPFFMFINLMEMHEPYIMNEPNGVKSFINGQNMNINKIKTIWRAYFRMPRFLDNYIGNIIKFLKNNGIYENTDIILTSDHGQRITQNYYGHGYFLTDDLIRVPLIVKSGKHQVLNQVISTTSVIDLIKHIIYGEDVMQINETAFSEAYGFAQDVKQIKNYRDIEVSRVAIFKSGYKLVLNNKGEVEEFKKNYKKIEDYKNNKNIIEELLNEIQIFKGNDKFMNNIDTKVI